ncbi:MAG: U2 snRNP complex subunit msl1 [Trizodia sp. TS-e1964]|nr:MAG: U2 snRNP complex subunit msl1 [Trizodia sp. TS-e1964]
MAAKAIPTKATLPTSTTSKPISIPPNQTLYCGNLDTKLQKEDLRRSLYNLFSTYGPVLDVVALKTMKMRGHAHIVFRDINTSTQAMRSLQGYTFFGREMRISYAKTKSDAISKLDGTFRMPSAAAGEVTATELQKSIFEAPPSSVIPPSQSLPNPPPSLKPPGIAQPPEEAKSPQGTKRMRDEEEDVASEEEGGSEKMDEDDDAMDVSSDED